MLLRSPSQRVFGNEQLDQRVRAGLVGHWIGGGSGNTWMDRSGYGNHGALTNGPTWTLGEGGKRSALQFDGIDDYVNVGFATIGPKLNGASAATFTAWLRCKTLNTGQYQNLLVCNRLAGDASGIWVNIRGDGGNAGRLQVGGRSQSADSFQEVYSVTAMITEVMYHVAGIFDYQLDVIRVFVNGAEETLASVTFGASTYTHSAGSFADSVGGEPNVLNRSFPGILDDVRIYNRDLSSAEIALLASPSFSPVVAAPRWIGRRSSSNIVRAAFMHYQKMRRS